MKKPSIRPVLTVTAACLLPAALHAQTTLQSMPPGGLPGESAAQPAGQSMATPMSTPMGTEMTVPVSPAQSISQPFSPVSSAPGQREGLQLRARVGVERDDNVTRTPGTAAAPRISDTITGLGVGARYQKRVSQQTFVVDAQVDRYSYDKLNTDYNTLNYSAAWNFRFGNRIDGIASADRRQFRDVTTNAAGVGINRRTERIEQVEGRYAFGAAWRALAGLQHQTISSTDPTAWDANQRMTSTRLGAQYESARGSTITTRWRHGDGEYRGLAVAGGDFKDDEIDTTVRWVVSPKTSVEGRIGYLQRDHDAPLAGRDFSGAVGGVNVSWDVTAKTRLQAGYARDLGTYLGGGPATTGHLASDRWYVGPTFRFTEQTSLNARYEHETRRFEDVNVGTDVGRRDKYNVLAVGLDWQVRRSIAVSAQLRNERRSSNVAAPLNYNYRANVIGLSARLTI